MSTLLLVHAHPDDESINTSGVMIQAHQAGHRVVLITCTRGEEGAIHNMDEQETRSRLAEVRSSELSAACKILGVDRLEFLGYRDSGMKGAASNDNPSCFYRADLTEAAERLSALLQEERPDVVVTYGPDGIYWHPDHVKAHEATMTALDRLAEAGWQPAKVYHIAVSRQTWTAVKERMIAAKLPFEFVLDRIYSVPEGEITTVVDCRDQLHLRGQALRAHLSQMAPDSFQVNMPEEIFELAFGSETFILVRGKLTKPRPEPDLFAGLTGIG